MWKKVKVFVNSCILVYSLRPNQETRRLMNRILEPFILNGEIQSQRNGHFTPFILIGGLIY